jgi:hypothetical protein
MKDHLHGRLRREGFALFALIVVIAIIVVLPGMLPPALAKSKTEVQGFAFLNNGRFDNGRFERANPAGPTMDGKNALSAHLCLSAPSIFS